ncbi:TetR/AcrR family transcriptional regulator [Crossiella sp. NPDC003009]
MSALIEAGQRLFGRDGYATTSIDAVAAAAASVTKGAAYHHFGGKIGLFRAVFVHQEIELAAALVRARADASDSWSALRRGCRTFLEHCLDQNVRQIILLDGPSVLGWDTVREIEDQHTLKLLRERLQAAVADGWIPADELGIRYRLLFSALCEAGMLLARSEDLEAALAATCEEVDNLLFAVTRYPAASVPVGAQAAEGG